MSKKTPDQRLATLEEEVLRLRKFQRERMASEHLLGIGQRITNRLFELGPEKVDMRLIAKLNAALGCDVMPIVKQPNKKP